ncbi:MAG: regulatory iron-sulfur-containing complex subunit RicT [Brevinemataceae bacterium]
MIDIVKVKVCLDQSVRYYKISPGKSVTKGMIFIGATKFGSDFLEIVCPKITQIELSQWEELNKDLAVCDEKKQTRFAFEPILERPAKESEITQHSQNNDDVKEYLPLFRQKIANFELEMKIVKLYYTFGKERLVCLYTSEKRVDFRELVRELMTVLKIRLELFQMNPREFASVLKGCGSCGRQLCCSLGCSSLLDKKLTGNVKNSKMLGVCGKIRCCASFENIPDTTSN